MMQINADQYGDIDKTAFLLPTLSRVGEHFLE